MSKILFETSTFKIMLWNAALNAQHLQSRFMHSF